MRNLILLFLSLSLFSCKKEPVYGPNNLKDGQEVELIVDHRFDSDQDLLRLSSNNRLADAALIDFSQREPGYTYRVKAIFHYEKNPPADGPSSYFTFKRILSKEQYTGTESFNVQLIVAFIPGGPNIRLFKENGIYYFNNNKLQLTYTSSTIQSQLEEIWQNAQDVRANWKTGQQPKWKAIQATVVHDPQLFGKAYLVREIKFTL